MKLLTGLVIVCALLVASVHCTTQESEEAFGTSYAAFPCAWAGDINVNKLNSAVYQCLNVRGRATIEYLIADRSSKSGDKFNVGVYNAAEYLNWTKGRPANCINNPQCALKDTSAKTGSYIVDADGEDYYVTITNQNRILNAGISVNLKVYTP